MMLPPRSVLDCLLQNFFKEANWIYEMIHPTTFLIRYESWWNKVADVCVADVEFGVLVLRICAYSAQFLPSRAYTADTICGTPLSKVRDDCQKLAMELSNICEPIGPRSLTSVQQLFFAACYAKNEGRMKEAWFLLGRAIRLAQDLGLHLEPPGVFGEQIDDLEKEMRRRTFWNLYIWDRYAFPFESRLDEIPTGAKPRLRLSQRGEGSWAHVALLVAAVQPRMLRV